jgi:hypothetical protein
MIPIGVLLTWSPSAASHQCATDYAGHFDRVLLHAFEDGMEIELIDLIGHDGWPGYLHFVLESSDAQPDPPRIVGRSDGDVLLGPRRELR